MSPNFRIGNESTIVHIFKCSYLRGPRVLKVEHYIVRGYKNVILEITKL
jgi:hypothetical protein